MVGASARLVQRLRHQHANRRVVDDLVAAQNAVMPVARIGIEGDIGDDADLRHGLLDRPRRAADEVFSGSTPRCRWHRARWDLYSETAPAPECRVWRRPSASRTATSTENRSTPGIEAMCSVLPMPSTKKIGQIRSLTLSSCSRTKRRDHSALRLRRGRTARSSLVASGSISGFGCSGADMRNSLNSRHALSWPRLVRRISWPRSPYGGSDIDAVASGRLIGRYERARHHQRQGRPLRPHHPRPSTRPQCLDA